MARPICRYLCITTGHDAPVVADTPRLKYESPDTGLHDNAINEWFDDLQSGDAGK